MSTSMPMPDQQPSPSMGGGSQGPQSQPPSAEQATGLQRLLAQWYQVAKEMAASDPRLASGAEKVSQGIQEMQAALVTSQPARLAQQPDH